MPRHFNGARTVFSTNGVRKPGYPLQKNEVGPLIPSKKINSKQMKDLNIRTKPINFLEDIRWKAIWQ